MLYQWIQILLKRKKLIVTYPELNNELANLLNADYVDEELQAYIYGHHLVVITVGGSLSILDLDHCQFLEIGSQIQSTGLKLYEVVTTLDNDRQVRFTVPDYPSIDT